MTRIALLQMTSGIDPVANAQTITDAISQAAGEGASMLFTPEMAGMLDRNRKRASGKICIEERDPVLEATRSAAATHGIWVALGSLALDTGDGDWVNRSLVIDGGGEIVARYDKIHMFDVDLANGESWHESSAYRPGKEVVVVDTPLGRLGLAICYDIRFPALFEALGRKGCDLISIPAAFTVPTGQDHWLILQRARAIEGTAYVVSSAQVGTHEDGRRTYGHSLVVDPWGEVELDMGGAGQNIGYAEIDLARVAKIRAQLPSLANRRTIPE